jgi:hypothetical protein
VLEDGQDAVERLAAEAAILRLIARQRDSVHRSRSAIIVQTTIEN